MVGVKSVWLTDAVGELVMSTNVDTPLRATFSTPGEDFSEEEEEEDVGAAACIMVGGGGAVLRAG